MFYITKGKACNHLSEKCNTGNCRIQAFNLDGKPFAHFGDLQCEFAQTVLNVEYPNCTNRYAISISLHFDTHQSLLYIHSYCMISLAPMSLAQRR